MNRKCSGFTIILSKTKFNVEEGRNNFSVLFIYIVGYFYYFPKHKFIKIELLELKQNVNSVIIPSN